MHLASLELLLQIQHNLVDSFQVLQKVFKSLDPESKSHQRGPSLKLYIFLRQSIFVELYAIVIGKFKCKTFTFENHMLMRLVFERLLQETCCNGIAAVMWHNFGPKKLGRISENSHIFCNLAGGACSRSKVNTCGWQKKAAPQENAIFKPGFSNTGNFYYLLYALFSNFCLFIYFANFSLTLAQPLPCPSSKQCPLLEAYVKLMAFSGY